MKKASLNIFWRILLAIFLANSIITTATALSAMELYMQNTVNYGQCYDWATSTPTSSNGTPMVITKANCADTVGNCSGDIEDPAGYCKVGHPRHAACYHDCSDITKHVYTLTCTCKQKDQNYCGLIKGGDYDLSHYTCELDGPHY